MKKIFLTVAGILLLAAACNQTPNPNPPAAINPVPPPPAPTLIKPEDLAGKQIIVFAFDGSKSLDMWEDSLDFARQMKMEGKPIHFTYFISGVYFLTYANRNMYHPPQAAAGTSGIGFADSKDDIIKRIGYVNRALKEGHEIGSHLNGHFNGIKWSAADWEQEFSEFEKLISNVNVNNSIPEASAKLNIQTKDMIGFRAPDLGVNPALWPVVTSHGYLYDTSTTGKLGDAPVKDPTGLWKFSIPTIRFANTNNHLLSMDYNFYVLQSNAQDFLTADTPEWQAAEDQVYLSYINYFNSNYNGSKAPVFIAHHFSKWNDGVYWEALKKFAEEKCGQADVRCVSFRELMNYQNFVTLSVESRSGQ